MSRKRQEWWKPLMLPGIVVASLGALGTVIVKSATYITLPDKVEAVEQTNLKQDQWIDKVTVLLEQNAQQAEVRHGPPWYDTDQHGVRRVCHQEEVRACWENLKLWQRVK